MELRGVQCRVSFGKVKFEGFVLILVFYGIGSFQRDHGDTMKPGFREVLQVTFSASTQPGGQSGRAESLR